MLTEAGELEDVMRRDSVINKLINKYFWSITHPIGLTLTHHLVQKGRLSQLAAPTSPRRPQLVSMSFCDS